MKQYIVFTNNKQDFAIDISKIERIIEFEEPKKVPEASDHLLGVIQYNSRVIPIIDLSIRLYNVKNGYDLNTKIIVVMWKDKLIGLVVDEILGIRSFDNQQYENTSQEIDILKEYVSGFIKEEKNITIVLDVDKVFDQEQAKELLTVSKDE